MLKQQTRDFLFHKSKECLKYGMLFNVLQTEFVKSTVCHLTLCNDIF